MQTFIQPRSPSKINCTVHIIRHSCHCIWMFWKKNPIIVVKQKCHLFFKKMAHKSISGHTAAEVSRQLGGQIRDLFTIQQQLLFLFSKHLDTMEYVTDCRYSKTNFCCALFFQFLALNAT